jgi:hypothetical protein
MTHWFSRKPGQNVVSSSDQEQHDEALDEHMLFVGADAFDWARVPPETPHADAGRRLRVRERFAAPCPKCEVVCGHHAFEGSTLQVSECTNGCNFIWYQLRANTL